MKISPAISGHASHANSDRMQSQYPKNQRELQSPSVLHTLSSNYASSSNPVLQEHAIQTSFEDFNPDESSYSNIPSIQTLKRLANFAQQIPVIKQGVFIE